MSVCTLACKDDFATEVKIALLRRGDTLTHLALRLGYARNTLSLAINKGLFPRVQRQIREALDL